MTQGTIEHLGRVEVAIKRAKVLLARGYPDPPLRSTLAIGLIAQTIEHNEAMLLLIRNEKNGSAFALARSIFESAFRGTWFLLCATDVQLQYFDENDELPPDASNRQMNMSSMATAIDAATGCDPKDPDKFSFTDLKNRGWKALCSYSHSGMLQIGRRFQNDNVEPAYTDAEIIEVTTSSTTCVLLLAGMFLFKHNYIAESEAARALVGSWRS
jgi:hypothetical protein